VVLRRETAAQAIPTQVLHLWNDRHSRIPDSNVSKIVHFIIVAGALYPGRMSKLTKLAKINMISTMAMALCVSMRKINGSKKD
jgi:hypothetical protein